MLARGETIGEPYPCIRRFCACRRLLASTVENSRARTIGWLDKIANIMCQTWNSGITRRLAKKKKKIVFFEGEEKKERRIFLYLYPLFKKRRRRRRRKRFVVILRLIIDYFLYCVKYIRYSSSFEIFEVDSIFNMQVAFNNAFMMPTCRL